MGKQYYYLVAFLPSLVFGEKAPHSSAAFLESCKEHLDPKSLSIVKEIILSERFEKRLHGFLDAWIDWDESLKAAIAGLRAKRLAVQEATFNRKIIKGKEEMIFSWLLSNLEKAPNPLNAEIILAKTRWDKIDEMESGHFFDIERIMAHALKLRLMERLNSFENEKGMKRFGEIADLAQMPNILT